MTTHPSKVAAAPNEKVFEMQFWHGNLVLYLPLNHFNGRDNNEADEKSWSGASIDCSVSKLVEA